MTTTITIDGGKSELRLLLHTPTGRQVVPDPEHTAPRRAIRRGSRVRHPTLGPGVVLEFEGEGDEARLTVFFERSGKRKLVAKFANLEML